MLRSFSVADFPAVVLRPRLELMPCSAVSPDVVIEPLLVSSYSICVSSPCLYDVIKELPPEKHDDNSMAVFILFFLSFPLYLATLRTRTDLVLADLLLF